MTSPRRIDGVDLSHYQSGAIDFAAAKKAGVKFVFHKATEDTGFVDPLYAKRATQVRAAGLLFGAYHFARPKVGDAEAQAAYFLAHANVQHGDLRPMLDLEVNPNKLSSKQLTTWVGTFNAAVKKKLGAGIVVYTHYTLTAHHDCPLWVARYSNSNTAPVVPKPWPTWTIWQFSDGQYGVPSTVPGIGKCDINTINSTRPASTIQKFVIKPPKAAKPKPVAKPEPVGGPTSEPPVTSPYADADLVIETANLRHSMKPKQAQHDLDVIAARKPDVVGFQESANWQSMIEKLPGYSSFFPVTRPQADRQTPLMWLTERFELIAHGSHQLHPHGTHKGYLPPAHWLDWVVLHDKVTGRTHVVGNTHTPSSSTVMGHPLPIARTKLYRQEMAELHRLATTMRLRGDFFLTGDWNVRLNRDAKVLAAGYPHKTFAGLLRCCWDTAGKYQPTHGRACYDAVWDAPRPEAFFQKKVVVQKKQNSDHKVVSTTYRVKKKG